MDLSNVPSDEESSGGEDDDSDVGSDEDEDEASDNDEEEEEEPVSDEHIEMLCYMLCYGWDDMVCIDVCGIGLMNECMS